MLSSFITVQVDLYWLLITKDQLSIDQTKTQLLYASVHDYINLST